MHALTTMSSPFPSSPSPSSPSPSSPSPSSPARAGALAAPRGACAGAALTLASGRRDAGRARQASRKVPGRGLGRSAAPRSDTRGRITHSDARGDRWTRMPPCPYMGASTPHSDGAWYRPRRRARHGAYGGGAAVREAGERPDGRGACRPRGAHDGAYRPAPSHAWCAPTQYNAWRAPAQYNARCAPAQYNARCAPSELAGRRLVALA